MTSDVDTVHRYRKKSLAVTWSRRTVRFDVPVDVFSSFQLDRGTALLLRQIIEAAPRWRQALDLGCGYGPIALCLSALGLAEQVEAVDRDALAVLFTGWNAAQNGAANVRAFGGLDYADCSAVRYDAVVSNLPAKAGEPVHRLLLYGAADRLTEGGEVWIVVVRPLAEQIDRILAHPAVRVLEKMVRQDHAVYRYVFTGRPQPPPRAYQRAVQRFPWGSSAYEIDAVYGLPEFDTRSLATEVVLHDARQFEKSSELRRVLVWNPGQGHIPIVLARTAPMLERISMVSRDLLALRASRSNLQKNGYSGQVLACHSADVGAAECEGGIDLLIGTLNEGAGLDVCRAEIRCAASRYPGVPLLLGCSASFAGRLVAALKKTEMRVHAGTKNRGFGSISYRP
jgi:16S rRNA (guanine1207-N2)-methyltransferase